MKLKEGDTIYAKVLFQNGFGAVGDVRYSEKKSVSTWPIALTIENFSAP